MNHTQNPHDVEARLERSLRSQVRVPKLDGRFDAAVWARIEAEKVRAVTPVARSAASRWMFAINVAGVLITVVLVIFFCVRAFTSEGVSVPVPEVSTGLVEHLVTLLMWPITILALATGIMFTPLGRRLRAEFG
ncbi:MAG TPA: hypothetical protein VFS13_04760 [Steroidobacteraceae bacterium]|nr:hypothetical protein [Steroidobacteraceae bacterium]